MLTFLTYATHMGVPRLSSTIPVRRVTTNTRQGLVTNTTRHVKLYHICAKWAIICSTLPHFTTDGSCLARMHGKVFTVCGFYMCVQTVRLYARARSTYRRCLDSDNLQHLHGVNINTRLRIMKYIFKIAQIHTLRYICTSFFYLQLWICMFIRKYI